MTKKFRCSKERGYVAYLPKRRRGLLLTCCETSYLVHMFPRIMTALDVKTISTRRLSYSSKVARQYQEAIDAFLLGDVELVEQLMRTR